MVLYEDHYSFEEYFYRLLPGTLRGVAPVVAGLPIAALTLDVTYGRADADGGQPWSALFAALHVAGFTGCGAVLRALASDGRPQGAAAGDGRGPVMCPLLSRLRIGGPQAVVTGGVKSFAALAEMLEWRDARGAARVEELQVGFVGCAKELAKLQAEYGPRAFE
ncbi:uncharacterized protein BXZ73DRAFT_107124 [Epithele typhae]|uniref:uncharacterized protein n=1 Tax=Epithele typhae TaxID=378194 RepID=UPI002008A2E9|nr:uncharacterized protein BXZ73DRAFT_107124 [Epithele typhae]KAH9912980.1 hypothetical protein BXZ73DRAFT_107124 [Epithele typhae]